MNERSSSELEELTAGVRENRRRRTAKYVACVGLMIVLGVAGWIVLHSRHGGVSAVQPVPPIRLGRFGENLAKAQPIGTTACATCHAEQHATYLETAHSQAFHDVDLSQEPPAGEFLDSLSGRAYEIYHQDGQEWHRESCELGRNEQFTLADFPVRYVIGSGRFSRSYVVERDGFLVQSPATWYAAKSIWDLSPGYEVHNTGFERPIVMKCLYCHVGRAEPANGSVQKFQIHSQSIDCERCHGSGSLHQDRWQAANAHRETVDPMMGDETIVHPGRLTRRDNEAICAQCHLHTAATVQLRGRQLSDYQPGLQLNDICIHYGMQTPNTEMQVVGHVEQMRLSACYQGSESLTCTTCHNPHSKPAENDRLSYFRDKCLECHSEQACGVPQQERIAKNAQDDCMACHMPKAPTDIPHFAFTHHRIGLHTSDSLAEKPQELGALVALDDTSHLPVIEQDRCLGLAYVQLADRSQNPSHAAAYRTRAEDLLLKVRTQGLRDGEIDATLARLFWRVDADKTIEMAESALAAPELSPESRATALYTLANTHFEARRFEQAAPYLEQLVEVRLTAEAWFLLSVCRQQTGNLAGALVAAEQATQISPQLPQLHFHFASLLQATGDTDRAKHHHQLAQQLARYLGGRHAPESAGPR